MSPLLLWNSDRYFPINRVNLAKIRDFAFISMNWKCARVLENTSRRVSIRLGKWVRLRAIWARNCPFRILHESFNYQQLVEMLMGVFHSGSKRFIVPLSRVMTYCTGTIAAWFYHICRSNGATSGSSYRLLPPGLFGAKCNAIARWW